MGELNGKQKLERTKLIMTFMISGALGLFALCSLAFGYNQPATREISFTIIGALLGFWLK
jgi:hypothetical protein